MKRTTSHSMLKRIVGPVALWAVTKALESPKVKKSMSRVDQKFYKQRRKAERSIARASANAMNNRVWLAAGLAAIVTGISLVATASKKR